MNNFYARKISTLMLASTLLAVGLPFHPSVYAADAAVGSQGLTNSNGLIQVHSQSTNLGNNATIVSPGIDTSSSNVIRVIVQLNTQPVAVGQYAAKMGARRLASESTESAIFSEQSAFVSRVQSQGINLEVNYQFNTVLNGMEVSLPANQIPNLAKISGVKSIYENRNYYTIPVTEPSASVKDVTAPNFDIKPIQQMGVEQVWNMGFTGKGLKVGVLDTGVDYMHPDLKDAFKKGHDSINNTDDPYEDQPTEIKVGSATVSLPGSHHGTHVSGTIAGRAANQHSDVVQKGIAYEADLYVYKVLGMDRATGRSTGSTAQVIDGIEHAVKDGMDVINLSLGSDSIKDPNAPDEIAINNAVLGGVVAVIANGNAATSGPYYYSMGSPASAQLGISVGAATTPSNRYTATVHSSVYDATYGLNVIGWHTQQEDFRSVLGTDQIDGVYVGLGKSADYANRNVQGKVAFVSRGDIPFIDKISYAKQNGAKAIIIFNGDVKKDENGLLVPNLSSSIPGRDTFINVFLGDGMNQIPIFDMSGKDGRAIAAQIVANPATPLQFKFGTEYPKQVVPGDTMADFSSRGPESDGNFSIKPDFTAPGVDILSTWAAYGKYIANASYDQAYQRDSGTSMATPHVAGAALLLKQAHRDWSPFDIRAALANTSEMMRDESGTPYDVYSQGAGRINLFQAVNTPAVLETVDTISILDKNLNPQTVTNYGDNASFGLMASGSSKKTETLQLKNSSLKAVKYSAKIVMHPNVTSDPNAPVITPDVHNIDVSLQGLDSDGSISADASSTHSFSLAAAPKSNAVDGVYEGEVVLESSGLPSLHLPFVVHVGTQNPDNGFGLQDISLTNSVLTSNGEQIQNTTDVSFTLHAANTNFMDLEVYGLNDNYIGTLTKHVNLDSNGKLALFTPGKYSFNGIDGSYIDETHPEEVDASGKPIIKHLTPGTYNLQVSAALMDQDYHMKIDPNGNYIVYTASKSLAVNLVTVVPVRSGGSAGGGSFGGGTPAIEPTPAANSDANSSITTVIEQGQLQSNVKPTTTTDGTTVHAVISDADLEAALKSSSNSPVAIVITVPVSDSELAQVSLTPSQLNIVSKAGTGSTIVINAGSSSVAVPASVLRNVPAGSSVQIEIKKSADQIATFTTQVGGTTILGTPVSFEVNIVTDNKTTPIQVSTKEFIKRSFTVDGNVDTTNAGALYIENGKVFSIPATFNSSDKGTTTVTVNRPGFSIYAAAMHQIKFGDIEASWAHTQIESLANKFLLNGTSDGSFSPKDSLTRAQFSSMLVRALGLHATQSAPFSDVTKEDWFANDVAAAYEAGLVTGVSDDHFAPQSNISRQDLTVMLSRAITLLKITTKSGPAHVPYADTSGFASYAADSIQEVTNSGLMSGVEINGSTYFLPTDPTTREAAAMVLFSLLKNGKLIN